MKRLLLNVAVVLSAVTTASAQSQKFDINVALMVQEHKALIEKAEAEGVMASRGASESMAGVVCVVEAGTPDETIEASGAEIVARTERVAVVRIPVAELESLASVKSVKSISMKEYEPQTYNQRLTTDADPVVDGTGEGMPTPFSGSGVITGIFDSGIDPNHINFLNGDGTASRVSHFYNFTSDDGTYTDVTDIANFTSDDRQESHGTHVLGIMSGGYKGHLRYALDGNIVDSGANPYYGLCSESEIVACAGIFTGANLIAGAIKMAEYAQSVGKPIVINYSIGGVVGPHDGTDPICLAFEDLSKKGANIIIAAGNDGDIKCALLPRRFSALQKMLRTVIVGVSPRIEFWNSTDKAFKFEFVMVKPDGTVSSSYEVTGTNLITLNAKTPGKFGTDFAATFPDNSLVQCRPGVDVNNNRYKVQVYASLSGNETTSKALMLGVRITGTAGETAYGYISGGTFSNGKITGWQDGSSNGSISDMATGKGIISVGSFNSNISISSFAGTTSLKADDYGRTGSISKFSSYGTNTATDQQLPDIVGPGCTIISSWNSYCPVGDFITAEVTNPLNGRRNYWRYSQGTSMACPYISGVVGLMLQADPTLDIEHVRQHLLSTVTPPPSGLNSTEKIQWGAGKVNVYEAIKSVLQSGAVENIYADDDMRLIVEAIDGGYKVFVAGESSVKADVVDMQGRVVASASADGCEAVVGTAGIASGIYVLDIRGASSRFARKIRL